MASNRLAFEASTRAIMRRDLRGVWTCFAPPSVLTAAFLRALNSGRR